MKSKISERFGMGDVMYDWATQLYPITRSITGSGVRETLGFIKEQIPELKIREILSGTKAFDWEVPDEWVIREAYVENEFGHRVIDFKEHNLHIVGYSEAVNEWFDLDELNKYLYSLPDQPDAIPYVTSYYKRRWGFCLTHDHRLSLKPGSYHVVIDSELKPGVMNYAELILPGRENKEVLLSTYICHPSMGNNELSGPVVTTALVQWLSSLENRRYTYRIVFIPETIGSIVYLSQHYKEMQKKVVAGFVVTCVGDDNNYSFLPSRKGKTLADRVAKHTLDYHVDSYRKYSFLERGSDERQYCSPLIDLPIVSIMRSKYGEYPEYHTSLDDLSFISPSGLEGAFEVIKKCLAVLENNYKYKVTVPCEPQLGKRGLYPTLGTKKKSIEVYLVKNLLAYADGKVDLIELASIIGCSALKCLEICHQLYEEGLLEVEL